MAGTGGAQWGLPCSLPLISANSPKEAGPHQGESVQYGGDAQARQPLEKVLAIPGVGGPAREEQTHQVPTQYRISFAHRPGQRAWSRPRTVPLFPEKTFCFFPLLDSRAPTHRGSVTAAGGWQRRGGRQGKKKPVAHAPCELCQLRGGAAKRRASHLLGHQWAG